ncbi:MAG: PD40 domain-containing protein [Candidatus Eremiobacteraeota bacterium]|nr:PD40 domain-containing protein [Candidatus Eremiobacteraeota bacterium]
MSQLGYYRFAAIAHDAIVFVCEDDLWTVPASGGTARRLTTNTGETATPRLSPDGSTIAFVAREDGGPEVYVMPAAGGLAKRLTFLGSDTCVVSGWTPDGSSILFCSDAAAPFSREAHAFRLPAAGGTAERLRLGHARSLAEHPDGRIVIGRNGDDPARWKRYKGGTAGDLWVDRDGSGHFSRLISLPGNPVWPMWVGDRVFFLSDHEGIGNLYSVLPDGTELRRHTHQTEFFVRFPSTDGARTPTRPAPRCSSTTSRATPTAPSRSTRPREPRRPRAVSSRSRKTSSTSRRAPTAPRSRSCRAAGHSRCRFGKKRRSPTAPGAPHATARPSGYRTQTVSFASATSREPNGSKFARPRATRGPSCWATSTSGASSSLRRRPRPTWWPFPIIVTSCF